MMRNGENLNEYLIIKGSMRNNFHASFFVQKFIILEFLINVYRS